MREVPHSVHTWAYLSLQYQVVVILTKSGHELLFISLAFMVQNA